MIISGSEAQTIFFFKSSPSESNVEQGLRMAGLESFHLTYGSGISGISIAGGRVRNAGSGPGPSESKASSWHDHILIHTPSDVWGGTGVDDFQGHLSLPGRRLINDEWNSGSYVKSQKSPRQKDFWNLDQQGCHLSQNLIFPQAWKSWQKHTCAHRPRIIN